MLNCSSEKCVSICAFDIGIKNLSYCIIQKNNDEIEIKNWELINLQSSVITCKSCGKRANVFLKNNQTIAYCQKHSKQYTPEVLTITRCQKMSQCQFEKDDIKCQKKSKNKINDKSYCSKHLSQIQNSHNTENKLCNIKILGCKNEPLYDIGSNMYHALEQHPEILSVNKIVIENQSSKMNNRMQLVSIILFSYFVFKKHQNVELVAPSGKLRINDTLTKKILSICSSKTMKYKITKEIGIYYCCQLLKCIKNNERWKDELDNNKKKDDLCDAFLHAWYHMLGETGLSDDDFVNQITQQMTNKIQKLKDRKTTKKDQTLVLDI